MGLYPKSAVYYSALVGIPRGPKSKVYIVDSINGSDTNSGTSFENPLQTLQAAYALTVDLQNDAVLIVGNGTALQPVVAVDWAKSYTHLIGLCADIPSDQRSRIKSGSALATTPFFTVSGTGCVIKNISFWHETSAAAGLVNVLVSGGRNKFQNCQFAGAIGSNNATGARSLVVGGANASGNVFKDCEIGNDTITVVNGVAALEFVTGAMHTTLEDCMFPLKITATTNAHVQITAAASVGTLNIFKRCYFVNETTVAEAEVFTVGAPLARANHVLLIDCWMYGVAKWDSSNRGIVTNATIAANTTGVNTGNMMVITSA